MWHYVSSSIDKAMSTSIKESPFEQLFHKSVRSKPKKECSFRATFWSLKQRSLRIVVNKFGDIVCQHLSHALVQIHCTGLANIALDSADHKLLASGAVFIKNITALKGAISLARSPG
jgi:hypothetical protein